MFEGNNIITLDVETLRSAMACRHCHTLPDAHGVAQSCPGVRTVLTQYSAIGWEDHATLGLAIGCAWDYQTQGYHWIDRHTLAAFLLLLSERQPLLVTFNGQVFDVPLLCTVLRAQVEPAWQEMAEQLCAQVRALPHYDILQAVWAADPASREVRGVNGLDALARANGFPGKRIPGALAPVLWQEGRIAEVIDLVCMDVERTRGLFARIVTQGGLWRHFPGMDEPWWLPLPPPVLEVAVSESSAAMSREVH
jgi:hypothetical protein